tara:strand:- start:7996 stop:8598 length:603 start_codon:yes stop_codon:yes gene_type:complete
MTHACGAFFIAVGTYFLISDSILLGGGWKTLAVILYGGSAFLGLSSSALFHGTMEKQLKRKFRILDHACIYIMIAGGYSPLLLIPLKQDWGMILFTCVWFLAISGVMWKIFYFNVSETISLASYLLLGWIGLFMVGPLIETVHPEGLMLMLMGGISYTVGVYFYINDHKKYYHSIWHILVLLGSACHYLAVFNFILPIPA